MSTPSSNAPKSSAAAGDDRNLVAVDETYIAPSLEDKLQIFWKKNSKSVITGCVLVLLAIVGKGAYEAFQAQQEKGIAADYVAAKDGVQLKAFAASHAGHELAGVALLRVADQAYEEGKFAEAVSSYEQAAGPLGGGALGARAKLGAAIAQVKAGKVSEGENTLKQLVADTNQLKPVRAEAAYNLASLAAAAGRVDEATKLAEQTLTLDPTSQWTQRALMLRSTLPAQPAAAGAAPGVETPTVTFGPKNP